MMGKVLRVFIIIHLVLMIPVIVLGVVLYNQREQLKARTHTLEVKLQSMGPTLEAAVTEPSEPPELAELDESPITPAPNENPERSDIWSDYPFVLEAVDNPLVDINKDYRDRLQQYYALDSDGNRITDPSTGTHMTSGSGTMQEALDEIVVLAQAQLDRLEKTRKQLVSSREDYIATIEKSNDARTNLRKSRANIAANDVGIKRLNGQITSIRRDITDRDDTISSLDASKGDRNKTLKDKDAVIARQENQIAILSDKLARVNAGDAKPRQFRDIVPGSKGTVKSVDLKWRFALLNFSENFVSELAKEAEYGKSAEGIELLIKRPNPDGTLRFIAKVRIDHVRDEGQIGVADILPGWLQEPLQPGDQLFYN